MPGGGLLIRLCRTRKSSAATATPLFTRGLLMAASISRSPKHQAPLWSSIIAGNGPGPRGLNIRASKDLSP